MIARMVGRGRLPCRQPAAETDGPRPAPGTHDARRRGFFLYEVTAAMAAFGIVLALVVQVVGAAAHQRIAAERRAWATEEVQNVLERLSVLPVEKLKAESLADLKLGERAEKTLPGGKLEVGIADSLGGKRLTATIRWQMQGGADAAPVRLTTWVIAPGAKEGPK